MNKVFEILASTMQAIAISLQHNWVVLFLTIMTAVLFKTYVNAERLSEGLMKRKRLSVLASVTLGTFTPFCACGTTAVIIGMLSTALPWSPVMAFLTSSPLISPDSFVMVSGILGMKFAIGLTIASLLIGIYSGFITNIIEEKTSFLEGQTRYNDSKQNKLTCQCGEKEIAKAAKQEVSSKTSRVCYEGVTDDCCESEYLQVLKHTGTIFKDTIEVFCCDDARAEEYHNETVVKNPIIKKYKLDVLKKELIELGLKQILFYYTIFVAVGYLINYFVPMSIISVLFGKDSILAVPLATLIGLPLYLTTESGVPIIHSLIEGGAGEGAMLAFMISGSATSAWVIAGLATFLKKKAIILYLVFILVGSVFSGYLYDFISMLF